MIPMLSIDPDGVAHFNETHGPEDLIRTAQANLKADHFICVNGSIGVVLLDVTREQLDEANRDHPLHETARELFLLAGLKLTKQ